MKIGDFGISRILMSNSENATTFAGTPYYMSPEMVKHDGYNSKSDIWLVLFVSFCMCGISVILNLNTIFSPVNKNRHYMYIVTLVMGAVKYIRNYCSIQFCHLSLFS